MQYVAFTDESYISAERYRSIACFSFRLASLHHIRSGLAALFAESGVAEFKWQKLKDAKYRFCAQKMMDQVLRWLGEHDIRVDVLIWDTHDSRHQVVGRDDDANYERMFFHLLKTSMRRRPRNAQWRIFPDERLSINWELVRQCLANVGKWRDRVVLPMLGEFISDPHYRIDEFQEIRSCAEPCCQVADLFAGMAAFSRRACNEFPVWEDQLHPCLPSFERDGQDFSNRDANRFEVIREFYQNCRTRKLGVSLNTNHYLTTPDPRRPLNFWHYAPQHAGDKAPVRI